MRVFALFSYALVLSGLALGACGGTSSGGADAAVRDASAKADAGADAGGCGTRPVQACVSGTLECTSRGWACVGGCGEDRAPLCFGMSAGSCCGQDPFGEATCVGTTWMCGTVAAPGCDNENCAAPVDSGLSFDSGIVFDAGVVHDASDGGHASDTGSPSDAGDAGL